MTKSHILGWATALALAVVPQVANALPSSHFTTQSKLAKGHWVKVAVTQSGIYQITLAQLQQMGFSNPSNIQVYGYGGVMLSQVLTSDLPDDLKQVPVLRRSDKICFYASGTTQLTLSDQPNPHYTRQLNTYSTKAYYFITESATNSVTPSTVAFHAPTSPVNIDTSLDALLHEQEKMSVAFTGSELLGEDLMNANHRLDFTLINPSDKQLGLTSRVAAKVVRKDQKSTVSVSGSFSCQLTVAGQTINVPYSTIASNIIGCTSDYTYYQANTNADQNTMWVELPDTCHAGSLHYGLTVKPSEEHALLHLFNLDYFIATYNHYNRLDGYAGAQCPIGLVNSTADHVVRIEGTDLVVWNVTTPTQPVQMRTRNAGGYTQFTPGNVASPQQYIAFAPSATLLEIDSFEAIPNQNLHGLAVPDMLIITHHEFMAQAERVAQMHRQYDGMDVLVLDQNQVFNEFSAGTPDAMAIRLLCKMFYDRNASKFKYLLVFGNLSFDNRGLVTGKQNRVISYVSSVSHNEDASYINDDFYGYLQDNSGQKLSADRLCIGIGHMPVANATEASEAVDKLQEYVYSTDYGAWRNNYSLWAENSSFKKEGEISIWRMDTIQNSSGPDTIVRVKTDSVFQLHESHAAGIGYIIDNDCKTQMVRDMAFVCMFPQNPAEAFKEEAKRTSTEAKRHIKEMFSEGQYFATYVGHAGANGFSASSLWTSNDVLNTPYPRLPIMSTACCDVARFDSDHRGICELMFHKRDGGAIALFTTTRQVLANLNDDINRAFTTAMFSYNKKGSMPRLGDCYREAKNYTESPNTNKFHWVLLGDPALRINYPKPLFNITAINGIQLHSGRAISAAPLQQVTIEAQVMQEGNPNKVNTAFNGEATITIYDIERTCLKYMKGTGAHARDTMTLDYPREKLVQVTGRVVGGKFRGSVVMPQYARTVANNENEVASHPMVVSVYAHEDGTDQMVNGLCSQLRKANYNASVAVTDHESPIIQAMFLNNEQEFAANATVGTEATLYIRATDNTAFNTQQLGMGRNMRLTMDGGKTSYNLAKNMATVSDEGRLMTIAMPLTGLTAGQHTLDFTVTDVCGNAATQSITFVVNSQNDLTLIASDIASSTELKIDLGAYALNNTPTVNVRVTDINGNLVWSKQTSSFPCTWNLRNNRGQRVSNGLYRIYGSYSGDEGYGGSNLINFVVLPAVSN